MIPWLPRSGRGTPDRGDPILNRTSPQADGLVGWWPLQGDHADRSGYGQHATRKSLSEFAPHHHGGRGALFTGVSGYGLTVPATKFPLGASERIISFWARIDAFAADISKCLLSINSAALGGSNGNLFNIFADDNGISIAFFGDLPIWGKGTLTAGEIYHIAAVVPPGATTTDHVRVFINGIEPSKGREAGTARTLNTQTGGHPVSVGTVAGADASFANAVLWDLRVYDRGDVSLPRLMYDPATRHDLYSPPRFVAVRAPGGAVTGSGAADLPAVTSSGTGEVEKTGSGAADLPALTASGSGSVSGAVTGSGGTTLPGLTASGAGNIGRDGAGDAPLPAITVAGSGEVEKTGSGAVDLPALTADGAGTVSGAIGGSGAVILPAVDASGTGEVEKTGSGAVALPGVTASGSGTIGRTGAGDASLPAILADGAGTVGGVVSGPGALSLPSLAASGTGEIVRLGAGALSLPAFTASAAGLREVPGGGALSLPAMLASGSALRVVTGAGALSLPLVILRGQQVVIATPTPARRKITASAETRTLAAAADARTVTATAESRSIAA